MTEEEKAKAELRAIARALGCVHQQSMGEDHYGTATECIAAIAAMAERLATAERDVERLTVDMFTAGRIAQEYGNQVLQLLQELGAVRRVTEAYATTATRQTALATDASEVIRELREVWDAACKQRDAARCERDAATGRALAAEDALARVERERDEVPTKAIDVLLGLLPTTLYAQERNALSAVRLWLIRLARTNDGTGGAL